MVAAAKLLRHAGRKRAGRFLAEGPNLVEAALERGLVIEVFVTEEAALRHRALLADLLAGPPAAHPRIPLHAMTERAAKALSDTVTPPGLVAVCRPPETDLHRVCAGARLVVVAVGVGEPGNAGTLIRLADAMGAAAVVFAGHSVDPYNGKCLRASTGSIFAVPVIVEPDLGLVVDVLHGAGLQVLATTVDAETTLGRAGELLTAPTAWLFGSEAHGLSPDEAALADHRVGIEMSGSAESLNVASAAAICLYQSARAQS